MFVWGSESFFATSLFAEEKFNNIFPELDNLYSSSVLAAPKGTYIMLTRFWTLCHQISGWHSN